MVAIAVAGASKGSSPFGFNVGGAIARSLLQYQPQHTLRILTRNTPTAASGLLDLQEKGAKIAIVDYGSSSSLANALAGVDVLISGLSGPALSTQIALGHAAKEAGVKVFFPSEFGNDTTRILEDAPPILPVKNQMHKDLSSLVPIASVFIGGVGNLVPLAFMRPIDNKVKITGSGDKPCSWTTISDLAAFLAYIVTHIPAEQLGNKIYRIEGSRNTDNELAAILKEKIPSLEVVYETAEDAEKRWKETRMPPDFWRAQWAREGGLIAESDDQLNNNLFPGHKWTNVADLLR